MSHASQNVSTPSPLDRVAVALDTEDLATFRSWYRFFGPRVGALKVGLEAFTRWGPEAVERARRHAKRLFLDLKLHDIPATVAGAVGGARALGVDLLTVHVSGGATMLSAAVDAAGPSLGILGVTVLTHLDDENLDELNFPGSLEERVASWAALASRAGCAGVVCSPREVKLLRGALPSPFLLVTPGVRPVTAVGGADDQRRTLPAGDAIAAGSDLLVIGRPLTRSPDPARALAELERELAPFVAASRE